MEFFKNSASVPMQPYSHPQITMQFQPQANVSFHPHVIGSQPKPGISPAINPGVWMQAPNASVPDCPPGLEYLSQVDQLLVHQKVEILEAFTDFETNNKYTIKNALGQNVYWALEQNDCCTRNCCGSARPFEMKVLNHLKDEVIHIHRPLACQSCCFPCCLQSMEISSPPGQVIGTIEQEWTLCGSSFSIKNQMGDTVLLIEGPCCAVSCFGDVDFEIKSMNGQKVGKISKQWSGLAKEYFTDADNFGISFPMDLDVKMKAVMLGACLLIDYMFFEDNQKK